MIVKRILTVASLVACALLALAGTARASTLVLSCEALTPGTASPASCPSTASMYSVPGLYTYVNTFTAPDGDGAITGSSINGGSPGFIDAYFFQIVPAKADAVTAEISDGDDISTTNLFARLYTLSSNPQGLVLGTPVGPVYNGLVTTDANGAQSVSIGQIMLPAGSYVLEISGTANGTFAGGYTGSIDLVPVPLPASFPLLLAGLLGFAGLFVQRYRNR
jgi:hypothetical protein